MRSRVFSGNRVRFLMDGYEFFHDMYKQLKRVSEVTVSDRSRTYVRMAYWALDPDVGLPKDNPQTRPDSAATNRVSLLDAIRDVVLAGHCVDLIVWQPNLKSRRMPGKPADMNDEFHTYLADRMRTIDEQATAAGSNGQVRVYRERYEGLTGA